MFSSNYQNKKEFTKINTKQFQALYTNFEYVDKGSFGKVFKAKNNHNKTVAVKQFLEKATGQFWSITKQIINLKKLDHPNILKFFQCYMVDESKYFLVTEYCENGTLKSYLENNKLTEMDKISMIQQIAEGLAYAHSQKIIHRDLKPDNILVGQKNTIKIADFGSSKKLQTNDEVLMSRVGSPAYMDDRVIQEKDYDWSVDIYGIGLVFYSIFKGQGIFDDCKKIYQIKQMKKEIYENYDKRMAELMTGIPQVIKQVIKNALQEDHKLRCSAAEISQTLKEYLIKNKQKSSKVSSTLDETESEISDKETLLSIDLLSVVKQSSYKLQCEQNHNQIFLLLNKYKENFKKIANIQKLKYVSSDTKAQYTFVVMFYYIYWLQQMDNFVHQKPSSISNKFKLIDSTKIQKKTLDSIETYLNEQLQGVKVSIVLCGKKILKIIHLIDKKVFFPDKFAQCVYNIVQSVHLDYNKFQEKQLSFNIRTFFEKRIKREYAYNVPDNETADPKLEIIEDIGKKFN